MGHSTELSCLRARDGFALCRKENHRHPRIYSGEILARCCASAGDALSALLSPWYFPVTAMPRIIRRIRIFAVSISRREDRLLASAHSRFSIRRFLPTKSPAARWERRARNATATKTIESLIKSRNRKFALRYRLLEQNHNFPSKSLAQARDVIETFRRRAAVLRRHNLSVARTTSSPLRSQR
jgi:hypothetical protein